ncbi:hypothetical protein ABW20_dc0103228 [Dactylellina cionopaga]|nr:hypothetical protein ABW20_dc0103228 [Dactylellina cionopaga]
MAARALVPAPRSSTQEITDIGPSDIIERSASNAAQERGLGTSADMYIFNDWPDTITAGTSNSKFMSKNPPSSIDLGAYSASSVYPLEANGWIPLQSSFKVNLKAGSESKIDVNIGMTPFKTSFSVDSANPAFQAGVMLAPAKILEKGRDFDFYFFSGPGVMPPLINSALDANLGAVFASIKKSTLKFPISNDVDITLKEILNSNVKCSYASVTPGSAGGLWTVNAIINLTADIKMQARFKTLNSDATLKVKGLSVLVTAQADLSGLTGSNVGSVGLSVTRFQTSLDSIDLDGDILVDIVSFLYPVFAPVLRLPYKLASIINTSENGNILKKINDVIQSFGIKGTMPGAKKRWSTVFSKLTRRLSSVFKSSSIKLPRAIPNISTWMSTPKIQALKLSDLYIPGTHDSHAYSFQHILSLIKYDDIAFLWNLDYFLPAPSDGSFNPLTMNPIHLGPVLGEYVMNSVTHISRAQGQDLSSQLNGGVRHFDLRAYYDPVADTFYTQHALRAKATLVDLITQVQGFLTSNPGAQELVILDISHTNFNDDFTLDDGTVITSAEVQFKFMGVIRALEQWVYMPTNARGTKKFNFQTLKDTKLSAITQGKNKVLIITPDFVLSELSVNTDGWDSVPSGTVPKGLYEVSTAAALTAGDIVGNVLNGISGREEVDLLGVKAKDANSKIVATVRDLESKSKAKVQLVSVDWFEYGVDGKSAAEIIVGLNGI